jgi:hypothetical protein
MKFLVNSIDQEMEMGLGDEDGRGGRV